MNPVSGTEHYENFPVASLLCPARLRPPILAIYRFARTADDLADEGTAGPQQRLQSLARYRTALVRACAVPRMQPPATADAWPEVFLPLAEEIAEFKLPPPLLHALLDAFEQDVHNPVYADRAALQAYCRRSANPIGRLLLQLYGVTDELSAARSDDLCTALQLINFWQDLSIDIPRGRHYVPDEDCARHGVTREELAAGRDGARVRALVRDLCTWAEELLHRGAPLAMQLGGRAGLELRLVVQGGLRILQQIDALEFGTLAARPRLAAIDWPRLAWRALWMRAGPVGDATGVLR
ncbi:MAG: squalene synthase HpnC [Rubrivivax sp.]|nr:squalene synthase HpnC [Rubrivivax sp.]